MTKMYRNGYQEWINPAYVARISTGGMFIEVTLCTGDKVSVHGSDQSKFMKAMGIEPEFPSDRFDIPNPIKYPERPLTSAEWNYANGHTNEGNIR